jgi:predicted ATP-dependent endonuclease of OLD family
MIVTRLKLANVRAIEAAEFRFQPGVNLIVGVNGVGKTSVLDALGVCLSAVVKQANKLRGRVEAFTLDDIRAAAKALSVECSIRSGALERDRRVDEVGELDPFCQVAVWWLEERLASMLA